MRFPTSIAGVVALLALGACTATPELAPAGSAVRCAGSGLEVDADFERGALATCTIDGPGIVSAEIAPEILPINDSAWYAFRVRARNPRPVTVHLRVRDGTFRYAPKISRDGRSWQPLATDRVLFDPDGRGARLQLDADRRPLLVAAQPLETIADALAAVRPALHQAGFVERQIGQSEDGRALVAFEHFPEEAHGLIVLLARQHPPETTGGDAFTAYARRLAGADPQAVHFRKHMALLVVPVMNPDGLARGMWRGNARGVDLNRDWPASTQPETRAVTQRIAELDVRAPLVALLDFHSTRRNVIYAAPEGAATRGMADTFLAELARLLGRDAPEVVRNHVTGGGTAKGWALEHFGVGGLTYEVGDATSPDASAETATVAAVALMTASLRQYIAPREPSFVFDDWAGPSLPVWSYRPPGVGPDAPLLFVMHGVGRDADRYLAEWIPLAEARRFIVVVPEYTRAAFPGAEGYNLGATSDGSGGHRSRDVWSFSAIEPLFDAIRQREQLTGTGYRMYGHSAGAQYVHRFVLLGAGLRLQRAVAANSGWYTFPMSDVGWPYGLLGAPPGTDVAAALAAPLTVLLGGADTDSGHPNLRRTPEANVQGAHRLARGQRFYDSARRTAADLGRPLGWSCAIAPGVGHDNARAADYSVTLLLDAEPPAAGPCRELAPIPQP